MRHGRSGIGRPLMLNQAAYDHWSLNELGVRLRAQWGTAGLEHAPISDALALPSDVGDVGVGEMTPEVLGLIATWGQGLGVGNRD